MFLKVTDSYTTIDHELWSERMRKWKDGIPPITPYKTIFFETFVQVHLPDVRQVTPVDWDRCTLVLKSGKKYTVKESAENLIRKLYCND